MEIECVCSCHISDNVMHCAPCCDGQCQYCLRYFMDLKEHREKCGAGVREFLGIPTEPEGAIVAGRPHLSRQEGPPAGN